MNEVDYIYEFLHDTERHRWEIGTVNYMLTLAQEDLTSQVEAFLKLRDINRKKAQLQQKGTHDETVNIQLEEDIDVYNLPEDFLRVSSVLYEKCFIPHQIASCDDGVECGDCEPSKVVRSYTTKGLPKGKIKISPTPSKWTKECVITETKTVEVLNNDSQYGWGLWHIPAKKRITDEVCTTTTKEELVLGSIAVTYEIANTLDFPDDANEIRNAIVNDKQLRKFYVCGHLLRDDKDTHSRTLGAEELNLYEARLKTMFTKYEELYEVDNLLELASAEEGYVDTKVNEEVLGRDAVEALREQLKHDKVTTANRNKKSRFDVLGVR